MSFWQQMSTAKQTLVQLIKDRGNNCEDAKEDRKKQKKVEYN